MSNGNASDSSTDSNKRRRVRISEDDDASAASGGPKAPHGNTNTPKGLADETAKGFVATLHHAIRNNVQAGATAYIDAFATWFRKNQAYLNMKNNPSYIPTDARVSVSLHPMASVDADPGFKDLVRETAGVVEQCRELLRDPILRVTKMNAEALLQEAQLAYIDVLPDIAELVVSDELDDRAEKYGKHQAVVDLVSHHEDATLSPFKLTADTFSTMYCKHHSLESLPEPSTREPEQINPSASSTTTTASGNRVGGQNQPGSAQVNNTAATQGGGTNASPPVANAPVNNNAGATSLAAAAAGAATAQVAGAAAAAPEAAAAVPVTPAEPPPRHSVRVQQVMEAVMTEEQRTVMETLSTDQAAAVQRLMEFGLTFGPAAASPPRPSSTNRAIRNMNNPYANADDGTGDVDMGNADGNDGNDGGSNAGFVLASDLLSWGEKETIRRRLKAIVRGAFVRPADLYQVQCEHNAKALRLKTVARRQTTHKVADKTAEALEAEQAVDPKIVRVLIVETATKTTKKVLAKEKEKKKKAPKQQQQQRSQQQQTKNANSSTKASAAPTKRNARRRSPDPKAAAAGEDSGRNRRGRSTKPQRQQPKKRGDTSKSRRSKHTKQSTRK